LMEGMWDSYVAKRNLSQLGQRRRMYRWSIAAAVVTVLLGVVGILWVGQQTERVDLLATGPGHEHAEQIPQVDVDAPNLRVAVPVDTAATEQQAREMGSTERRSDGGGQTIVPRRANVP